MNSRAARWLMMFVFCAGWLTLVASVWHWTLVFPAVGMVCGSIAYFHDHPFRRH